MKLFICFIILIFSEFNIKNPNKMVVVAKTNKLKLLDRQLCRLYYLNNLDSTDTIIHKIYAPFSEWAIGDTIIVQY